MLQYLPPHLIAILYALIGVLGLVMGSALNCLCYRMVKKEKWSGGRSACPTCGHTLSPLDLVPLFSWLCLGGKCRYCKTKISPRYPMVEGLLALIYISLLWRFDLSWNLLSTMVLCSCLLCLSLVDLDTMLIPDRFLIIPAVIRLIQLVAEGGFTGVLYGLLPGIVLGGGVLILSLIMDKILKKDTMGGGDIKLLALLGMFLTFPECLMMLVIACIVGIVMASVMMKVDSETAFPFGPAIALSGWLTLLFGSPIINWYLSLF